MSSESQNSATGDGYLSHRQILVVLSGVMAGMSLAALDQSIVGVALPRIVSELGGLQHLSWVVTAYLLTSTASTPLWGKISDLYGRRPIFQIAIGIFLVGSIFAGVSQSMGMLIGARAIQGLGGGGLFALALAIIGDVIPPRERGRYQGYFAAVFGISSVAGPLLGGWLTDGPGWRWIFFINVPVGAAALVVTSAALRNVRVVRREHIIDVLGGFLIVSSVSCVLLYTAWAGAEFGWGDARALAILLVGIALVVLFVLAERRTPEPILPLTLFRNRIFSYTNLYAFLLGAAMFGTIIFLPLYLQVVKGMSPTQSGLALLPMVVGIFSTSISSGILMSRSGRYKRYLVAGAALTALAIFLLSQLEADTSYLLGAFFMYLVGAGLGMTMQTSTVAIQNAVDRRDLGVATSAITFFRSMGGAFGTAIFGAILNNRLAHYLAEQFAGIPQAATPSGDLVNNVQLIRALPADTRERVVTAFLQAFQVVFLSAVPLVVLAVVVAVMMEERELASRENPTTPFNNSTSALPE